MVAHGLAQLEAGDRGELDRKFAARRIVEAGIAAGLSHEEALRTTKSGFFKGLRRPRSAPVRKRLPKKEKPVPQPRPVENTDLGNARRLAGLHGHELRHCAALGWFTWDGRRWKKDDTGAAMRFAKDTAEAIWDEVKSASKDDQEEMAGWALASQSAARLEAMLRLAATEERIAVAAEVFDADPWVLIPSLKQIDDHSFRFDLRPFPAAATTTVTVREAADPAAQRFRGLEELQAWTDERLAAWSRGAICPATGRSVEESWRAEQEHLAPLPVLPEPFDVVVTRGVAKDCMVAFEGRSYAVPFEHVGTEVEVRGCAGKVQVLAGGRIVREYERGTAARVLIDPSCYEGKATDRVIPPAPLGRMSNRLQEILAMPVATRPLDLYAALAEVAR
jgi:hypothetical protein